MSDVVQVERITRTLATIYAIDWPTAVRRMLFAPEGLGTDRSLEEAIALIGPLPPGLLPLAGVDERSVAVVAIEDLGRGRPVGSVLRLMLTEVAAEHQLALLDIDPLLYVASVAEELAARKAGLKRVLDEIGPAYEESHLERGKRPRDHVIRPVRIACQNVIVALAAIAQNSTFDGLSVPAWQTCEVPHVATHEANRALAALTLCDAFQKGGTMEIRFDRPSLVQVNGKPRRYDGHPEHQVPASLRRFARTVGVALGQEDPAAIVPTEARELFRAITPMPTSLRERVERAVESGHISTERICFTLLSADLWRDIELDFLLATSARAPSILRGGAPWSARLARQAESEICRAAVMMGMLHRRLATRDVAGADGSVRVIEDRPRPVTWQIDGDKAAVTLDGLAADEALPWVPRSSTPPTLTIFPRARPTPAVRALLAASSVGGATALVVPSDAPAPDLPDGVLLLRCPDRLADIDKRIEQMLTTARMARA